MEGEEGEEADATAAPETLEEEEEEEEEERRKWAASMAMTLRPMALPLSGPMLRGCGLPSPGLLPPGEPPPPIPQSLPRGASSLPFPLLSLSGSGKRVGEEEAPDGKKRERRGDSPSSSLVRWAFGLWTSRAAKPSTPPPPRPSSGHRERRR